MKAQKLIAIALILSFASLGFAQSDRPAEVAPNSTTVESFIIPLFRAIQNPILERAIREQITPRILEDDKLMYTEPVRYQRTVLYVTGTFDEWRKYFSLSGQVAASICSNLIQFEKAMMNKGLVQAMRAQLTPDMLNVDKQIYIASVRFQHDIKYVSGTYVQWKLFFHIH